MKRPTKFSIMRHNRDRAERVRAKQWEESDDAYAERLMDAMRRTPREEQIEAEYAAQPRIQMLRKPRRWWWPLNWSN